MQFVKAGVVAIAVAAVFLAGYLVPPLIWTRAEAAAAVSFGSAILRGNITLGNSRIPCRGPSQKYYVFGYTVGVTNKDWPAGGSGSVCWDIFNSKWDWRIDPPYDHLSSDRSIESRSGIR